MLGSLSTDFTFFAINIMQVTILKYEIQILEVLAKLQRTFCHVVKEQRYPDQEVASLGLCTCCTALLYFCGWMVACAWTSYTVEVQITTEEGFGVILCSGSHCSNAFRGSFLCSCYNKRKYQFVALTYCFGIQSCKILYV